MKPGLQARAPDPIPHDRCSTASSIAGHTPPPPPAPHFALLPGVEGTCRRALETRREQDGWDGKEEQRAVLTAGEGGERRAVLTAGEGGEQRAVLTAEEGGEQRAVLTAGEGGEQEQSWADPKFLDSQRMVTSIRTMAARAEGAMDRDKSQHKYVHLPCQDEPVHNHVPERRLSKKSSGQHQQGVKPGKKPKKKTAQQQQKRNLSIGEKICAYLLD